MRSPMSALADETIQLTKDAFNKGQGFEKAGITVAGTQLTGYELEAPSKKLYPVLSPLRNMIARTMSPVGATASNWKAITGVNTTNIQASVPFGTRNAGGAISYTEVNKAATYKSFGLDDQVDDEAVWLSRGFENARALSALATLQATMIEEEKIILGGITTVGLGAPTGMSLATIASGGTWATTANSVYVQAVPVGVYGTQYSQTDPTAALTRPGLPSALVNAAKIALAATTNTVQANVTPVNGALGYAWFTAEGTSTPASTAMYLQGITYVPTATITGPATSANTALSTVPGTDNSADANAFDGLIPQILNPNVTLATLATYASGSLKIGSGGTAPTNCLVFDMLAGPATPGTALTSDNAGGIKEFNYVLKALYDRARIGPSLCVMSSDVATSVTQIIGGGSTGLGYRANISPDDTNKGLIGGIYVSGYLNRYTGDQTPGNPDVVPFLVHPYLAPGTVVFLSMKLPYPNNNVNNVLEMEMQQEYADFEWARVQRRYEHGVYANGTLKHYFPAGCAIIRSIAATS